MDKARWQEIERIFQGASELAGAERAAFLDGACRGDEGLRAEVESLLAEHDRVDADHVLSRSAVTAGLSLLAGGEAGEALAGRRVGAYRVIGPLGRGGMGEVYLAEDARLARRVALKLLPSYLTGDAESVRRFEREALAAAAISHPNVAHIYGLDQTDGAHYIVMEYVPGMTLRQVLSHQSLSVAEAVELALQVAEALAAAHEAGVIHRDIKPENIVVQPKGHAKVLDFGLAKLLEMKERRHDPPDASPSPNTTPGLILGTTAYMSPEQARGLPVDARTDLWSLGCVL